jgi:hypothetical protein
VGLCYCLLTKHPLADRYNCRQVAAIAKDGYPEDTLENRRLGWQRMCLLVLYFNPSGGCCGSVLRGPASGGPRKRPAVSGAAPAGIFDSMRQG